LVLITDDGQWLHQVSSGKKNVGKSYLVTLADSIPESEQALIADSFKQGIMLKGETNATRPAEITFLDDKHAEICIHEGRYHQVKRMFAYHGNAVCDLHRYQIESLIMDPALEEGYARALNEREIALFSHLNQAP
jgi:16S rRNA pseudouridine516 synthase